MEINTHLKWMSEVHIDCASSVLVNLIESKSSETLVNGLCTHTGHVWYMDVTPRRCVCPLCKSNMKLEGEEGARRGYWAMNMTKVHDLHV